MIDPVLGRQAACSGQPISGCGKGNGGGASLKNFSGRILPFCLSFAGFPGLSPGIFFKKHLMANTADISRGLIIKLDGSLYTVVEYGENKTARAAAKVWAKLKGVDNNRTIEKTWNSGETIFPVRVERKNYQFLYKDDSGYNFMDNETFEQVAVNENMVDAPQFLKEGQGVSVLFNTETEQPMSVELPDKVVFQITYSEPGVKGDTATRTLKAATIETGATVMVPLFVNEGDMIRINTSTGEYIERVKE
jgi:elongation factor P